MTEEPSAVEGARRRTGGRGWLGGPVSGLAEDIFNWLLCVKSIYVSYKTIGWLRWIYGSQ